MPNLPFQVKCDKCKAEVAVTDVEQDATVWDVDCGFDDRTGNHSHIWLERKDVVGYCTELQAEIKQLRCTLSAIKNMVAET